MKQKSIRQTSFTLLTNNCHITTICRSDFTPESNYELIRTDAKVAPVSSVRTTEHEC